MAENYTNKNTKVTDDQILFIDGQLELIDEQIKVLQWGKQKLFKTFNITKANFYIRKNNLTR